ncbi:MAG TPA: type II secretion system F family protein [Holophaga sp.]|nr:type II secretion system F family protein [Holophaga sp.]
MPAYAFRARDKGGRAIKGVRPAASEGSLAQELGREGLFLIGCEEVREGAGRKGFFGPRIKRKDLIAFYLHLGSYLEAGVPLLVALEDYRVPEMPAVDEAIQDLRRRIEGGSSLSDGLELHPTLFKPLHVNMIRAGESSGHLDEAIREVVRLVEWDEDFSSQVKQASTYPLIVVGLVALVVLVVSTFALPVIMKMLRDLNVPLPLPTRIFILLGEGLGSWGWLVVLLGIGGTIAFKTGLRRSPGLRLWWDTRVLKMPLVGGLALRMGLSRFATFFAAQYRAGLPILQVLKECQDVTGNARLALCVRRIREGVEAGERLAVMAAGVGYFPNLVVRMLAIGEEAGNLEQTLGKVSAYFDAEVRAGIKRFFQMLEPLMLVVLGAVIVFVAVAILLPIYTMIGSINAQAH